MLARDNLNIRPYRDPTLDGSYIRPLPSKIDANSFNQERELLKQLKYSITRYLFIIASHQTRLFKMEQNQNLKNGNKIIFRINSVVDRNGQTADTGQTLFEQINRFLTQLGPNNSVFSHELNQGKLIDFHEFGQQDSFQTNYSIQFHVSGVNWEVVLKQSVVYPGDPEAGSEQIIEVLADQDNPYFLFPNLA
jgi:hypothetical protein